jgi:heme-NO-binding protein
MPSQALFEIHPDTVHTFSVSSQLVGGAHAWRHPDRAREFVTQHYGTCAWREVQRRAELPARIYVTSATYLDSDVVALVGAASALTGKPASEVMEAFGEGIVPGLLQVYGRMVKKGWRTLDVLEHTEAAIHAGIRRQTPGAEPPQLSCSSRVPRFCRSP